MSARNVLDAIKAGDYVAATSAFETAIAPKIEDRIEAQKPAIAAGFFGVEESRNFTPSPTGGKKVIASYNAARQGESEAKLRSPEGEAERQKKNAEVGARLRAQGK